MLNVAYLTKLLLIRKGKGSGLSTSFLKLFILANVRDERDRTTDKEINCQGSSLLSTFEALEGGKTNSLTGDSALMIDYWHQSRTQLCQQAFQRLRGKLSSLIVWQGLGGVQLLASDRYSLQTLYCRNYLSISLTDLPS